MFGLRGLAPWVRPHAEDAFAIAHFNDVFPTITSVTRSWEKQTQLYNKHLQCVLEGRFPNETDCKWPANRPGDSAHNFGMAFDSWVPDEDWALWTAIREYVGFRVPQRDEIHAEVPNWRDYAVLRARM